MERERANLRNVRDILRSVIIITVLVIPCIVTLVIKAVLCVVKKFYAYVQGELELFNEFCEGDKAPLWDKEGLFEAFIKGGDVHSLRQTKNILRPKAEKTKRTAINSRVNSEIAMTSTVKRPMMLDQFIRDLVHERPCPALRVYTDITGKSILPYSHRRQDRAKIDASKSDSNLPTTKDIVTGAKQLRKVNGNKHHRHGTAVSSVCANREDYSRATGASSELNSNEIASVPCSAHVAVHSENSGDRPAQAIKRSSLRVDKRKKRSKDAPRVGCSNKVCADKKVAAQDQRIKYSISSVDKAGKKRGKDMGAECANQVSADKNVTTQAVGRSTPCSVKKAKKRGKAMSVGYSSTVESEQSAKKQRQESVAAHHHPKIPAPSSFRKMIKEKTSKTAARLRAKLRQRKLMMVELKRDAPSNVQPVLMKANQEPVTANVIPNGALINDANIPSPVPDQEPTEAHSVLGELVSAKRPLPVTPFTVQPTEESRDTDQASPSITELVCLMEKFHITPSEEPTYAADESDCNSVDDCEYELYDSDGDCVLCDCDQLDDADGEYDLFPELKSLPEQVFQIIQLLP